MRAYRLRGWGQGAGFDQVPVPEPGPGAVLLRVEAVGLCQSDLHLIDAPVGGRPYPAPFTLGHEIAGAVVAIGSGVSGLEIGEHALVYGPTGCGRCSRCRDGSPNYCDRPDPSAPLALGIGRDGGMAEYVLVPSAEHVIPIGELDPALAAPLADAALTPYHCIAALPDAVRAEAHVAVIGVGGLGHLAVQILEAIGASTVIAIDMKREAVELALAKGAEHGVVPDADAPRRIRATTGGVGCDVVLDFVGSDDTLALGADVLRVGGTLVVVGSAGGTLAVRKGSTVPRGVRIWHPFWGTLDDLRSVVELAQRGALGVETEPMPLDDVADAIGRLRAGAVHGRITLLP